MKIKYRDGVVVISSGKKSIEVEPEEFLKFLSSRRLKKCRSDIAWDIFNSIYSGKSGFEVCDNLRLRKKETEYSVRSLGTDK